MKAKNEDKVVEIADQLYQSATFVNGKELTYSEAINIATKIVEKQEQKEKVNK